MKMSRGSVFVASLLMVAGCGVGTVSRPVATVASLGGKVSGGQQPVSGATIQLYEVGTTGAGSAATPLLNPAVTTDAGGNFSITNQFTCSPTTAEVYLVATGGNPGLGTGTNANLALMLALGPCNQLTASQLVVVDEVTTVAAVMAFAPYMSSYAGVGSSAGDTGISAAFTLASQLANPLNGMTPGTNVPAGYAVPVAEINTLANILSSCVNSAGGVAGDTTLCGQLFTLTTATGASAAPTNTIAALLNVADNPVLNTASLFSQSSTTPAFQPFLGSTPSNFQVNLIPTTGTTSLTFSATSVTVPSTAVGYSSLPQVFTITNNGSVTVTFDQASISGPNAADFAQVSDCASLAAGASCQFQVVATPSAAGTRTATLTVPSSASGAQQSVALSVTGSSPAAGPISVSATALNWTIANTLQDITVTNTGTTALSVKSVTVSDPHYVIAVNTCGTSLPAQSLCTISVAAEVLTGGATPSGTLTINDDAATGPQSVSLSSSFAGEISVSYGLTGNGNYDFGLVAIGATSAATFLSYTGPTGAFPATLYGDDPGDFTATACAASPCTIGVRFVPAAGGVRTAKIGSSAGYFLVKGEATGGTTAQLTFLSPGTVTVQGSFNEELTQMIGSGTIGVVNSGGTTMHLTCAIFSSAPTVFYAIASSCSGTGLPYQIYPAGASGEFTVTAEANIAGPVDYTGTLVVTDLISGISLSAPISMIYPLLASPNSLNFGSETVGLTSASQSVTLGSEGGGSIYQNATLSVSGPFQLVGAASSSCAQGSACPISIAFSPTAAGPATGYLTANSCCGVSNAIVATLNGVGVLPAGAPVVSLTATSLTFAPRPVNSTSLPMTVTLTNTGSTPLAPTIGVSGAVNNNFTQTNNCPAQLAAGAYCTISVTFAPTASGTQGASVVITSNAASSPDRITLSGSTQ